MKPLRAWDIFTYSGLGAFLAFLTMIFVSIMIHQAQGELNPVQTDVLLRLLYWGCYPLAFVALGALIWHFVKTETGGYA